jgi:pimeloyl-ACP methyl ester carboxylesterase
MADRDGGLADTYWHQYYTPGELEELLDVSSTTMFVSGRYPIHARLALQPHASGTVLMAHGLLLYGAIFGRMILPYYRAGFNVVQFDMPGFGQSGGPRGGCTAREIVQAFKDAFAFARSQLGGAVHFVSAAEDGIFGYYALANHPDLHAMTLHVLYERGDDFAAPWLGSGWAFRAKRTGYGLVQLARPTFAIKGTSSIPWHRVFPEPSDRPALKLLERDPLALRQVQARFGASFIGRERPPVPFEECRTPVQVVASEHNEYWPYDMVARNVARLGGPKELLCLPGKAHWELNREFAEIYCAHSIRWFTSHGAATASRLPTASVPPVDSSRPT